MQLFLFKSLLISLFIEYLLGLPLLIMDLSALDSVLPLNPVNVLFLLPIIILLLMEIVPDLLIVLFNLIDFIF